MPNKTNGTGSPYSGPKWTDGFPHDFHGWGPQTPDTHDEPGPRDGGEHIRLRFSDDLTWRGEEGSEDGDHVVWRFDRKPH